MAEIRKLVTAARPTNQSAIDLLEASLARARAGEVIAIAIVEVCPLREVSTAWARDRHYHELNSGCARLAVQMASEPDDC